MDQIIEEAAPVTQQQVDEKISPYEIQPLVKPKIIRRFVILGSYIIFTGLILAFIRAAMEDEVVHGAIQASELNSNLRLFGGIAMAMIIISNLITLYFEYNNTKAKKYLFFGDHIEYEEGFFTIRKKNYPISTYN